MCSAWVKLCTMQKKKNIHQAMSSYSSGLSQLLISFFCFRKWQVAYIWVWTLALCLQGTSLQTNHWSEYLFVRITLNFFLSINNFWSRWWSSELLPFIPHKYDHLDWERQTLKSDLILQSVIDLEVRNCWEIPAGGGVDSELLG